MDVRTYIHTYVCMYVPELRHTGRKPLLQLQQPMQCVPVVTGDLVAVSCAVEEDSYTGHRSIDLAVEGRGEEGRRKEWRRERRRKRHRSCAINLYLQKMPITYISYINTYIRMYEFRLEWHVHTYIRT